MYFKNRDITQCVEVLTSPIKVEEFFVGCLKVDDTSGLEVFNKLKKVLKTLDLDIENIRGQGYDNGYNMRGKHIGAQKRLLVLNPSTFYMCGCHRLNLALYDIANSCSKAWSFFGVI